MTGLSAAYMLSKANRRCLLIERQDRVGGLCRSLTLDGVVFDIGPHVFIYRKGVEAEEFILSLLGKEEVIRRRWRFGINNGKRTYALPMSITDLILYPWRFKRQMLDAFLKRNDQQAGSSESVAQDMINKFGRAYYEEVFEPMLRKKTLISGHDLHLHWVARVDRDARNKKEDSRDSTAPPPLLLRVMRALYHRYYYPVKGFERLPQRLWQMYSQGGGETILDCGQLRFNKAHGHINAVNVKGVTYPVQDLIWTGSIDDLNTMLGIDTPRLNYVRLAFVFLTYERRRYIRRPLLYVYYTSQGLCFKRVYFPSSIYGSRGMSASVEGICVIINYEEDFDNQHMLDRTVEDIERAGLFKRRHLRQSRLLKVGECMPVYGLNYEQEMAEALSGIHGYNNVYSVGRMGGFLFCMAPAAVSQGFKVAREILKK
ncbi:MAG: FAD-dependent oxidoreductase [Nitrospirae bacterium]|nr:FAD-dependent oxidoreductase [Nitrospirota bacterium]MBF0593245.1 FAD-dependent oxidoreductase [Nitrospirota bacterium]